MPTAPKGWRPVAQKWTGKPRADSPCSACEIDSRVSLPGLIPYDEAYCVRCGLFHPCNCSKRPPVTPRPPSPPSQSSEKELFRVKKQYWLLKSGTTGILAVGGLALRGLPGRNLGIIASCVIPEFVDEAIHPNEPLNPIWGSDIGDWRGWYD